MIVDDSEDDLKQLQCILESAGHSVVGIGTNGYDGVDLFRSERPDLIILDLIMPGIDGIDALRKIRSEFADARVIMCTSIGQELIVDLAMRSGADGYFVKPYDPKRLIEAVNQIME